MTPTEVRYAQIEKEALALTWACEKFGDYLVGLKFHIFTDHKPLVPLQSTKHLDELPLQVQRFRLRLMRYYFTISHVPGKDMTIPDALSRAPTTEATLNEEGFQDEVNAYVNVVIKNLPASQGRIQQIRKHQEEDAVLRQVSKFCYGGWPDTKIIPNEIKPYHSVSSELSVEKGLLLRGSRIVIPHSLQADILAQVHRGHQGITTVSAGNVHDNVHGGLGCLNSWKKWCVDVVHAARYREVSHLWNLLCLAYLGRR